jgi:integrase
VSAGRRANGEGSIYPYRDGMFAAYVWVSAPDGKRRRKYVYGATRELVHTKWLELHRVAAVGPVSTTTPTLSEYMTYWLREVVAPSLKPKTAETYEMHHRLYIERGLGRKRLDRIIVRDVRTWLNRLAEQCQCCEQGKDAARPEENRRCCAVGECCEQRLSRRTVLDVRAVLRSALSNAMAEELITRNVATGIKMPRLRTRTIQPWSVEEARRFLESARNERDPFYPAYVLILVLGLRRGEMLGLTWPMVNLDTAEVEIRYGLQRIGGRLVHGETKTQASDALLPLPDICSTALRLQEKSQAEAKAAAGPFWVNSGYVFSTRDGLPIDPRNFHRAFKTRCVKAGVRPLPVHGTRHTCGSLLATLDVHPRVAMQILRHSKIAVTMEIYTHIPSELTRNALHKLGDSLDELTSSRPSRLV